MTNNTSASLRSVAAVVTWYASDGTFITSDDSLIDYNPLLPGQSSPFSVLSRHNPAMARCTVAFKYLSGGQISYELR